MWLPAGAAVDPVLVLEADDVGVGEVQEVGRPEVALQVLLVDLEPDLRRVVVPLGAVVDRDDEALGVREVARHRGVHVVGEGGDPALPGQVVADEGDLADADQRDSPSIGGQSESNTWLSVLPFDIVGLGNKSRSHGCQPRRRPTMIAPPAARDFPSTSRPAAGLMPGSSALPARLTTS